MREEGRINEKGEGKERDRGTKGETPTTPSRESDTLMGEEEQNEKQKGTKRKKQGEGPQPSYLGAFFHLLEKWNWNWH